MSGFFPFFLRADDARIAATGAAGCGRLNRGERAMISRIFVSCVVILALAACAGVSQPVASSDVDETARTRVELVICSPFKLHVQARRAGANGDMDLTFTAQNGNLRAKTSDTSLSGGVSIPGGEVKYLQVDGKNVQFTSAGGSPYTLTLKEGCELRGSFTSTQGRMEFDVFPR